MNILISDLQKADIFLAFQNMKLFTNSNILQDTGLYPVHGYMNVSMFELKSSKECLIHNENEARRLR
jgi:hypothetical protein